MGWNSQRKQNGCSNLHILKIGEWEYVITLSHIYYLPDYPSVKLEYFNWELRLCVSCIWKLQNINQSVCVTQLWVHKCFTLVSAPHPRFWLHFSYLNFFLQLLPYLPAPLISEGTTGPLLLQHSDRLKVILWSDLCMFLPRDHPS